MLNLNEMMDEFNNTYDAKVSDNPLRLIMQEYDEMMFEQPYSPNHLKELVDIIYITAQQMRAMKFEVIVSNSTKKEPRGQLTRWLKYIDEGSLTRANLTRIIFRAASYANKLGYDWRSALDEVHRSNMSKTLPSSMTTHEASAELEEAKARYPDAVIRLKKGYLVLTCKKTKKIIKPMCHSPAVIKTEWCG